MISVIDYGCGNLGSVVNMLQRVGHQATVIRTAEEILAAEKLILPGVGAFDTGMSQLRQNGLVEALEERVIAQGVFLLGICLGMQLLLASSDEGQTEGLGWIPGRVAKLKADPERRLRVPNMGWREVHANSDAKLFDAADASPRFYFVHSYYAADVPEAYVAATSVFDTPFPCAVQHETVFGTQFHPEKSHRFGMALMKNFAELKR